MVVQSIFSVLAWVLALLGAVALLWGVFTWDWAMILAAGFALLNSYAWGAVARLADQLDAVRKS